jgi:LemA protein
MPYLIWTLVALAVVIFAVLVWYVSTRNSIKKAELKVGEAESGIDVALAKRYDMLTKASDAARVYSAHEKDTVISVAKLRDGATMTEKSAAAGSLDEAFGKISALAESYPALRSSEVYTALQAQIADAEEHLQAARRLYNSNVTSFNEKLETFPSNIVAGRMCLVKKDLFTAGADKRKDVAIK